MGKIANPRTIDPRVGAALCSILALSGCQNKGAALSHSISLEDTAEFETPDLGELTKSELRLGAIVDLAPVYAAAHKKSPILGYLHAGETVVRSEAAHENDQCISGWYQIAPRGYVCTEKSVTIDLNHPTLIAMSLTASMEAELPFTYARTAKVTGLFTRAQGQDVELSGRLAKSTVLAVVGSWTAPDESGEPQRLGLLTDGKFVRADDLLPLAVSTFAGVPLNEEHALPLAFVVRRGVHYWEMKDGKAVKTAELEYHARLNFTGRYRTLSGERFWATSDSRWVRHRDVTVLRRREQLPEFASEGQKWLDVSIITGSAVAYEGQTPVFATLVSVGRDRLGDPKSSASTAQGTFRVVRKQVTRRGPESYDLPLRDAPWAMELENGQWLQAAPNHDRFGIENTDGNIEVSAKDGRFLFNWSAPLVPQGWHGIIVDPAESTLIVEVRK